MLARMQPPPNARGTSVRDHERYGRFFLIWAREKSWREVMSDSETRLGTPPYLDDGPFQGGGDQSRVMGIDYGERRVGIALSDPTRTLATPLPTLQRRRGKRPPIQVMADLAVVHGVGAIVLGLPLDLSGEDTPWTREVRAVGSSLAQRTGLPVHLVDERMTSVRAERQIRSSGLPRNERERKDRIDAGAATLILQSWLDREKTR